MRDITKICLLITFLYAAVDSQAPPSWVPTQQGLTRLFFSSRVTARNPRLSMECFADYILHSNEISEVYGSNYNQCLFIAKEARAEVELKMLPERKKIVHISEQVCKQIFICNSFNSTLDLFNCHANAGTNNTRQTYVLSGNSSELSSLLQEHYRTIDLQHEQCANSAEREYVESSAQNYQYLHGCLDGRVKPRPAPTSTTTTTTTSTTTTTTTPEPPIETTTIFDESTEGVQSLQDQFTKLLNLLH